MVLPCFSFILSPLRVFRCSSKPSVISMVLQVAQKVPVNSIMSMGGVRVMSLANAFEMWRRL